MGFWDSVGSTISSVGSVISSIGGSLGKVAGLAGNLLKVAGPYINTIMTVVQIVSQFLGILKQDETPEELGDKAMRADKQPEDFDTTQEYISYLREEVEFDKEEFDKLSDEEKLARSAVGTTISMKAINETKEFDVSLNTWKSIAKLYDKGILSKEEGIDGVLDEFKNDQEDLNGYVNKEIKGAKGVEVAGKLAEAYQKLEPELSTEEIEKKVFNSKIGE